MTSFTSAAGDPVQEAGFLLMRHARAEFWPTDRAQQQLLLRRARAKVHPDRHNGDRAQWDELETAARTLGLM